MNARRELKTRQQPWVAQLTERLVATNITPNQISLVSIVFAALAGGSFYLFSQCGSTAWLLLAPLFIQLRLLCNLMDGLVAVEGGKGTPAGELFNDIPDRFADVFILLGAGFATLQPWGGDLGWGAGLLAVLTAYIRTLGGSLGAPISFAGPMAKQHRMAVLTLSTLLSIIEGWVFNSHHLITVALIVICLGSVLTCWRRAKAIFHFLEHREG